MILFGCLLAFGVAMAPRLVLLLAWIFGRRWDIVWQGNWIAPLLGIIFLPYTTVMYLLVWSPTGLQGFDWVWLALGVLLDIMKWGQIARNREGIPGQGSTAQPAAQEAAPSAQAQPAAQEEAAPSAQAQPAAQEEAAPSAQAQPAAQKEAAPSEPAQPAPEKSSAQSELDGLAKLRDEGVITEEEYQAKKDQLET